MWYALQGRVAELAPLLGDTLGRHHEMAAWRPFHAIARLAGGDRVGAEAELASLMAERWTRAECGIHAGANLAGLAALCVGLRDRHLAPALYERVSRRPERWAVTGWATFGPWALAQGSLARLCERPAAAAAHYEEAIRLGSAMGSRPVVAQAQTLLAAVWLSADPDAATRARAIATLGAAEETARDLGLRDALERIARLRGGLTGTRLAQPNVMRREGDFWTVRYGSTAVRLKDTRGLGYLATLVASPGRECHVLQLAAAVRGTAVPAVALGEVPVGSIGGLVDHAPDRRARREYAERLREVRADLDEAERLGDLGRYERLRTELEHLLAHLDDRFGRHAHAQGPGERARKAVTKALRTQIGKLLHDHPTLGRHLAQTVRMGTFCVYAPTTHVTWET
jgi:hypothetical protein